jgi:hypothetical protein
LVTVDELVIATGLLVPYESVSDVWVSVRAFSQRAPPLASEIAA